MKILCLKRMTFVSIFFLLLGLIFSHGKANVIRQGSERRIEETEGWKDMKLWYRQPANLWIEALPVGNGRLGAMVFSRVREERIQLNEETIWSGGAYVPELVGDGAKALPEIRRLVFERKYREAQALFGRATVTRPRRHQKYQSLGDLWLEFPDEINCLDLR